MRANCLAHRTRASSYVAQKNDRIVPRFVHKVPNGDAGVWSRWLTPTRVGVNISEEINSDETWTNTYDMHGKK